MPKSGNVEQVLVFKAFFGGSTSLAQRKLLFLHNTRCVSSEGRERIKGQWKEQQSDRTENHDQNELYLSRFDVEKGRVLS